MPAWTESVTAASRNHVRSFLRKSQEYLTSAWDNLDLDRYTAAAGDAIRAGISAKDAIVVTLTGATIKGRDHAIAGKELARTLGPRPDATVAVRALRELISAKADVEYGTDRSMRPRRPRWSGAPAPCSTWPSRSSNSAGDASHGDRARRGRGEKRQSTSEPSWSTGLGWPVAAVQRTRSAGRVAWASDKPSLGWITRTGTGSEWRAVVVEVPGAAEVGIPGGTTHRCACRISLSHRDAAEWSTTSAPVGTARRNSAPLRRRSHETC
jgi:hypothetical protein